MLFFGQVAVAQTQHGAADADQELLLPLARPIDTPEQSSLSGEDAVLFPVVVESERRLRIATGPVRGGYFAVGGVICDLVNAQIDTHRIECLVRPTSGSGENVSLVLTGAAEMGLVQSDWQSFAVTSGASATDSTLNFDRLRSVASLYPLATQIVARKVLGATDVSGLEGRRIGLSVEGTAQRQLSEVILAQAGVSLRNLSITEFDRDTDMVRALCDQSLDAFVLVGPAPMQSVEVALNRCDAQLLSVSPDVIETLMGDREALASFTLGSETYGGQEQAVTTLGYVVTLVSSAGLNDTIVAEVARQLVEGADQYRNAYPALASVDGRNFFSGGLTAPVHDGVARYLDTLAAGFQNDSEDGFEETEGSDDLFDENADGTELSQ